MTLPPPYSSPYPSQPYPSPADQPSRGSWPMVNVTLTVVAVIVLVLGILGLIGFVLLLSFGAAICGNSCDQAQILLSRVWTTMGIGLGLAVITAIASAVWRRWSSVFLGVAVLIVVVTGVVVYVIGSTPLSAV